MFEHDLRANASRLSRAESGTHFSGSCLSRTAALGWARREQSRWSQGLRTPNFCSTPPNSACLLAYDIPKCRPSCQARDREEDERKLIADALKRLKIKSNAASKSERKKQRSKRYLEQRLEEMMTDIVQGAAPTAGRVSDAYRWTQLTIGVAAMVMIANYQY